MISFEAAAFHGLPAGELASDHLRLVYLTGEGPRIVGLFRRGAAANENYLAELPERSFETPNGRYHLRGGHRLWTAPETWPLTQLPDHQPPQVEPLPGGVRLSGQVLPQSGLRKSITVRLDPHAPRLRLEHVIENCGESAQRLAAWGITMLPLGGTALLPFPDFALDGAGLQPNRRLALWPYTRLDDPRLALDGPVWRLHASGDDARFKLGWLNLAGWCAYCHGQRVFVKRFDPQPQAETPDFGSNCEVYTDAHTLELETLGALVELQPGDRVQHDETWDCLTAQEAGPFLTALPPQAAPRP